MQKRSTRSQRKVHEFKWIILFTQIQRTQKPHEFMEDICSFPFPQMKKKNPRMPICIYLL